MCFLVTCVLVFTVFLCCFVYVYLIVLLLVNRLLPPSENLIAVNNNNNNNSSLRDNFLRKMSAFTRRKIFAVLHV